MVDTRCDPAYLAWLLAWDMNFLPDVDAKHENVDVGGGEHFIILGSHGAVDSKVLIVYDHEWDR